MNLGFGISIDMSVAFYCRFSGDFVSRITLLSSCLLFITNVREITLRFYLQFGQSDHPLPLLLVLHAIRRITYISFFFVSKPLMEIHSKQHVHADN